jgi:Protein of unknown function (DUF4239)
MNWIHAHSPGAIALIVFVICYSTAALIFGILRVLSKYRVARDIESITPAMVTPIGVIGGLLIAFLAARVWSNLDHANSYVGQEANAIRELDRLADEMPSKVREAVRQGAQTYVSWVTLQDWPQMVAGEGAIEARPPGLLEALTAIATYNPAEAGQRAIQQSALASLERALDARRNRLVLSRQAIGWSQWAVVWALYVFSMLLVGFVHMPRPIAKAVAMWLYASTFALCIVLLSINDRPFRTGGYMIGPTLLKELSED